MMQKTQNKTKSWYLFNSIVGIAIMLVFSSLPPIDPITPIGMQVVAIFLGVIYLWTTVDPIWPSLLGVALLGFSNYAPMNQVLMGFLGDPTVVQMLFMMVFIGALVQSGLTNHIGNWFLTRKIINGRPWAFTMMVLLGVYVLASLSNAFAPIFLFWPILYGIFKDLGYKPGDKYATLMLLSIVMASLFGFSTAPFKDVPLILITNYKNLTGVELNYASYMGLSVPLSLLCLTALVLFMKYVLKPDVSRLKNINVEMFNKNPLPPLNTKQKILGGAFILYILAMLLPGVLPPTLPVAAFLNANKFGIGIAFVSVLCAIKLNGEFIINYQAIKSSHVQWSTVFLIAAALSIGNAVTSEATGVTPFLKQAFTPIFGGTTELVFTILLLIIALVLTNFCNSAVVGMIFLPIVFTFSQSLNFVAEPIVAIFIYLVLIAAVTPAASPFAAILHGNKEWLKTGDIYKYTTIFSIIVLAIVIVVGIPLSKLVF